MFERRPLPECRVEVGQYVKHKREGWIARVRRLKTGKISVWLGAGDFRKYNIQDFDRHFVVVSRGAATKRSLDPTIHLAMKWHYNDAGWKGICTWKTIQENIKNPKSWCSNSGCWRLQKNGARQPRLNEPRAGWPCDEARLFSDYSCTTGGSWLAEKEGRPGAEMVISKESQALLRNQGRMALMTTNDFGCPEKKRYIFGIYEISNVNNTDPNDGSVATLVNAKEKTSFVFDPKVRVPFWKVYQNSKGGEKWGQGIFRYFSAAQTLDALTIAVRRYSTLPANTLRRAHLDLLQMHRHRIAGQTGTL